MPRDCRNTHPQLVRVLLLPSNSDEWITLATGHVHFPTTELSSSTLPITIVDSEDNSTTLFSTDLPASLAPATAGRNDTKDTNNHHHQITSIDRQQATVIVWSVGGEDEIALSFEGVEGCDWFWAHVCEWMGRDVDDCAYLCQGDVTGCAEDGNENENDARKPQNTHQSQQQLATGTETDSTPEPMSQSPHINTLPVPIGHETIEEYLQILQQLQDNLHNNQYGNVDNSSIISNDFVLTAKRVITQQIIEGDHVNELFEYWRKCKKEYESGECCDKDNGKEKCPKCALDYPSSVAVCQKLHRLHCIWHTICVLLALNNIVIIKTLLSAENCAELIQVLLTHTPHALKNNDDDTNKNKNNGKEIVGVVGHDDDLAALNTAPTPIPHLARLKNPNEFEKLAMYTFRLQYLKDVVLPAIVEEEAVTLCLFQIRCNFVEIVERIESEADFFSGILEEASSSALAERGEEEGEEGNLKRLFKFLIEYLTVAGAGGTNESNRHQNQQSLSIYAPSNIAKLFSHLSNALELSKMVTDDGDSSDSCRLLALRLLLQLTTHNQNIVKKMIVEGQDSNLLARCISVITCSPCVGCGGVIERTIVQNILFQLLGGGGGGEDVGGGDGMMSVSSVAMRCGGNNDDLLNVFYPKHALALLQPLLQTSIEHNTGKDKNGIESIAFLAHTHRQIIILEILQEWIGIHKYRMKYLLFRTMIIHQTLGLLTTTEDDADRLSISASHALAIIKVFKAMLLTGDDFYLRFITKQSLIKPIIQYSCTIAKMAKDNAVSAAICDLWMLVCSADTNGVTLIDLCVEGEFGDHEEFRNIVISGGYRPFTELLKVYERIHGDNDNVRDGDSSQPSSLYMQGDVMFETEERRRDSNAGMVGTWADVDKDDSGYFDRLDDVDDDQLILTNDDDANDVDEKSTSKQSRLQSNDPESINQQPYD